ncbi:hypothetical protein [Bacillus wiedmannii]|uniref:hypothetical protein n=2 Tax=Bacillus wiedmannii TaxID=1890302 RepID=UPI0035581E4A
MNSKIIDIVVFILPLIFMPPVMIVLLPFFLIRYFFDRFLYKNSQYIRMHELLKELCNLRAISIPFLLGAYIKGPKMIDAAVGPFSFILKTNKDFLLEGYKDSRITEYLLGHELTHTKYKDSWLKILVKNLYRVTFFNPYKTHCATLYLIFKELRADIESGIYGRMSIEDYRYAQKSVAKYNEKNGEPWRNQKKKDLYKQGYPTRRERIKYSIFCMRLQTLGLLQKQVIEDRILKRICNDYFIEVNVPQRERKKIESEVLNYFWKDCKDEFVN